MTKPTERFFYHSFPRRGRDAQNVNEKGLQILASIATGGLLLTPEEPREWRETLQDGTEGAPTIILQKRVCFTELAEHELARHSKSFGSFAIEFSTENLRALGAMPAFYLPPPVRPNRGLSGVATTMVARMGEAEEVLSRLVSIVNVTRSTANKDELINVTRNGEVIRTTRCTAGGAEDLATMLFQELRPAEELLNAARAVAGLFCPTEEFDADDKLSYYREREWRIIANVVQGTRETTRALSDAEKQSLLSIDAGFFEHRLRVRTGEQRRVDLCKLLTELDDQHVLSWARRVIVPDGLQRRASEILRSQGHVLDVVPDSALEGGMLRRRLARLRSNLRSWISRA